jgi:4-hydroxy-tetrahydrodipicolinate synthase
MTEAGTGPAHELGGIIAAAITPLRADLRIDGEKLAGHAAALLADGCRFVSPFGSTGEGPSFSVREKSTALRTIIDLDIPAARLIPAAMSANVDDAAASIAVAAELGCRAVLVVPPYYYGSAGQDGVFAFFEACAARFGEAFPVDIVLYHIPAMSRIGFTGPLIRRLVERFGARIVGIKDSTGDTAHTVMLAREFPGLRVFTGDDRVLPALLAAGGAGMIGGLPNVVARDLRALFDAPPKAREEMLERCAQRIAAVDAYGGVAALKALVARLRNDPAWAYPMPPLTRLDDARIAALCESFAKTGFRFYPDPA